MPSKPQLYEVRGYRSAADKAAGVYSVIATGIKSGDLHDMVFRYRPGYVEVAGVRPATARTPEYRHSVMEWDQEGISQAKTLLAKFNRYELKEVLQPYLDARA